MEESIDQFLHFLSPEIVDLLNEKTTNIENTSPASNTPGAAIQRLVPINLDIPTKRLKRIIAPRKDEEEVFRLSLVPYHRRLWLRHQILCECMGAMQFHHLRETITPLKVIPVHELASKALAMDTLTSTSPATQEGCPSVIRFEHLCHLNATLTCSENRLLALKMCIPICVSAVVVLLLIVLAIAILCGYYSRRKKKKVASQSLPRNEERQPLLDSQELDDYSCSQEIGHDFSDEDEQAVKQRTIERISTQKSERHTIVKLSKKMFKNKSVESLPDIGSRLQKYWSTTNTKTTKRMQIIVKSSTQCRLKIQDQQTLHLLKCLFGHLQHPYLHQISDVAYKDGYIGILQQYMSSGSIRDYIYKASPHMDWKNKYSLTGEVRGLPVEKVAKFGCQILKAIKVLYELGFEYIGQIHSGNVFIVDDHCVLGGFENTLLGFRTSCFATLQAEGLVEKMDIIMFGHLIYEMCCGHNLLKVKTILSSQEIQNIEDGGARSFIQFIFDCVKKKKSNKELIQEILNHSFLETVVEDHNVAPTPLPYKLNHLLTQVFFKYFSLDAIINQLEANYSIIQEQEPSKLELGWRPGKVWAKVRNKRLCRDGLLTAVAVPDSCPIFVKATIQAIKRLFLIEHENVVNIRDVDYIIIDGIHVVVIFQDWEENGSLKDFIYQSQPSNEWSSKYNKIGRRLKVADVRNYGAQILQAMMYWSSLLGEDQPLTLGHIHTGNIFVSGDTCRVGGFENTLLGFTARKFKLFEDYLDKLDVYMFGHVIYEMSTGMELETAIPTEKDLKAVPKELHPVFHYIFDSATVELQKILEVFPSSGTSNNVPKSLDPDVKYLLEKVRKGKSRNQDDQSGRRKDEMKIKLKQLVPK